MAPDFLQVSGRELQLEEDMSQAAEPSASASSATPEDAEAGVAAVEILKILAIQDPAEQAKVGRCKLTVDV